MQQRDREGERLPPTETQIENSYQTTNDTSQSKYGISESERGEERPANTGKIEQKSCPAREVNREQLYQGEQGWGERSKHG